jgi:hypothetical protein
MARAPDPMCYPHDLLLPSKVPIMGVSGKHKDVFFRFVKGKPEIKRLEEEWERQIDACTEQAQRDAGGELTGPAVLICTEMQVLDAQNNVAGVYTVRAGLSMHVCLLFFP